MAPTTRGWQSRLRPWLLLALLALMLPLNLLAGVPGAAAFDYTVAVTTTADTNNACATTGTGTCSLRDAVRFANLAHSADSNVTTQIWLRAGTYALTQGGRGEDNAATGDLDIRSKVTISGTGAQTTVISGGNGDRIFDIFAGFSLTLYYATVRDGNPGVNAFGGAIRNAGSALLAHLIVTGNTTTGAGKGGGVASSGELAIGYGSVYSNFTDLQGGGIYVSAGTLEVANSTISSNNSNGVTGGVAFGGSTGRLIHATVAANVGTGVERFAGALTLQNTLVAGNAGANCAGSIVNGGYNLDGGATCGFGATSGSLSNAVASLDILTGAIPYHPLLAGSAARDRIPATGANCISLDQRLVSRPQGATCDIGAFEYVSEAVLTLTATGSGSTSRSPAGSGGGPFTYAPGTVVTLTPQPGMGQTFTGWTVDGVNRGWATPLTITMDASHEVRATFVPTASFPDVGTGNAYHGAIVALATRGTIRGYGSGNFGPGDGVQRAQMAALIARAMSAGPGVPPTTLVPPACIVAGSWDCEDWGTSFTDPGGIDPNLWRNAGTLQHYGVALGYSAADCAARGRAFPCYGPTDPVSYAQTIAFVTRAMVAKGYWLLQPGAPLPYAGVPGVLATEVRTFAFYCDGVGAVPADWNGGATRGWFAQALWDALNSYWGIDGNMPDGRPAGGRVP